MLDIIGGVGVLRDCMGRMVLEKGKEGVVGCRYSLITMKIRKRRHFGKSASYTYFILSRICKLAAILNNRRRMPIPLLLALLVLVCFLLIYLFII